MGSRSRGWLGCTAAGLILTGCAYFAEPPPPPPPPVAAAESAAPAVAEPPQVIVQPVPAAPPPPEFAAHIASYKNQTDAEKNWSSLVRQHRQLADLPTRFIDLDLGGQRGRVTRVAVGEFADRQSARSFCAERRREGLYCAPLALSAPAATDQAAARR